MCHATRAGGLALLFSHGNCEQGTQDRDELIRGYGAAGPAAPPHGWQCEHQGFSLWLQGILVLIPRRPIFLFSL